MTLQSPITFGERNLKMYASRLERLGIFTFEDFLLYLPVRFEDYSIISKIGMVQAGEVITVQGQVVEMKNQYLRGRRIKTVQKAVIKDDTGQLELVWFNQPFLVKSILPGNTISVSGRVESKPKTLSINSPVYELIYNDTDKALHTGRLVPVYSETKGVSSKWLRRQIYNIILQFEGEIREHLPEDVIQRNNFLGIKEAVRKAHFPENIEIAEKARERLAFDELFLLQLASAKRRQDWKIKKKGHKMELKKFQKNINNFISSLPFTLTDSQEKAIGEILGDLSSDNPMNRLLQGDVGSGKTIVGTTGMYLALLNGFQSVLMAPTEILANQHYQTISKILSPLGIKVELLTGSMKSIKEKVSSIKHRTTTKKSLNTLYSPLNTDILIGTHAVLNEKIKFDKLGLVIIDEQQRFGVEQRSLVRDKGENPHLLTMTATPIPRTVALTMYGDLDLSYLKEMPKDRKKIKTWLVPPEKRNAAYAWIEKQVIETKSQAFIICPFIEDSESMTSVKAAKSEFEKLKDKIFPNLSLGLLHGKLKSKEKEEILEKFRKGLFDILVTTPVVEVGIDIPNATIMMIEGSERFGLSQLHQLRGRVGRGDKQSYCLLFTDSWQAINSQRLKGLETLYSGAELAELDLKLRGPGNMYGTSQHGIPKLKAASFSDINLLQRAKHEADKILNDLENFPKLLEKVNSVTHQKVSPD